MAHRRHYVAVDVGASSGRVMLGGFDGERIGIDEIHRFDSTPVRTPAGLFVDDLGIHRGILAGLAAVAARNIRPESIGIDTWGVTCALVDVRGQLCGHPIHYRDGRAAAMMAEVYRQAPREDLFAATGVQELPFNTSFMLRALADEPSFAAAQQMLMLPDLFASWLCGTQAVERTNASTTQLYDALANEWSWSIIDRLGLPRRLFSAPLVDPGQFLDTLLPEVADATGLPATIPVLAVASHDTASAVVAVPGSGGGWAFLSSGTWSLLGVERAEPVRTATAMAANLTNEVGVGGTTRLLRNVMGLWLLQESRRAWAREGNDFSFAALSALAESAPPFGPVVDPDHPSLFAAGDLPARIRGLCAAFGPIPETVGGVVRCAMESLALKYRWTIRRIEEATGDPIDLLHVVGGGTQDRVLCQLTADACGIPVLAGPVEAAALGNVLVQAMADGQIAGLTEARTVVRRSFAAQRFDPGTGGDRWAEAAAAFDERLARSAV